VTSTYDDQGWRAETWYPPEPPRRRWPLWVKPVLALVALLALRFGLQFWPDGEDDEAAPEQEVATAPESPADRSLPDTYLTLTDVGDCFHDSWQVHPDIVNVVDCDDPRDGQHVVDGHLPASSRSWTEQQRQDAADTVCAEAVGEPPLGLEVLAVIPGFGSPRPLVQCFTILPGTLPPTEPVEEVPLTEVEVGDCFDGTGSDRVIARYCVEDHDAELVAVIDSQADAGCELAPDPEAVTLAAVDGELWCLVIADDAHDRFPTVFDT
jgi:hypothetical protein